GVVAGPTLQLPPAEVRAPPTTTGPPQTVDLLPAVLADVADPQVAREPVEREPPRIARADGPDLVQAGAADVRVAGRIGVLEAARPVVDIDPQDLPEARRRALSAVARVACGAAVAHADVEVAVRPE